MKIVVVEMLSKQSTWYDFSDENVGRNDELWRQAPLQTCNTTGLTAYVQYTECTESLHPKHASAISIVIQSKRER